MNTVLLATEIAIRVPAMMQECAVNRAHLIQGLIESEIARDEKFDYERTSRIYVKQVDRLLEERDFLRKQLDEARAGIIRLRAELTAANEKRRAAEEDFAACADKLEALKIETRLQQQ